MKNYLPYLVSFIFLYFNACADTLVMFDDATISGTVLQTNGGQILLLTDYAAYNFSKASIKEIQKGPVPNFSATNRLPNFRKLVAFLSEQPWATNLMPIPATVIDKGILKNVPYSSFRCGQDYEANVYGDLDRPAGIEIGVYRKLLDDDSANSNCLKFITDLLGQPTDRGIVQVLDRSKDLVIRDGLTFEITPPTDEDAYGGWWISVYSEQKLDLARASDKELSNISITKADAVKSENGNTEWSQNELKLARHPSFGKITFRSKSGRLVEDADVVRINDGVSLVWEKDGGSQGGVVRLENLSEDLQKQFGYDRDKTTAADEKQRQQELQRAQNMAAYSQTAQSQPSTSSSYNDYSGYSGYSGSGSYSGSGRVYVHGYTRRDGTYVNSYTRSYPHRH